MKAIEMFTQHINERLEILNAREDVASKKIYMLSILKEKLEQYLGK